MNTSQSASLGVFVFEGLEGSLLKLNVLKEITIATPLGSRVHGVTRTHFLLVFEQSEIFCGIEARDMGITTPQSIQNATFALNKVHAPNLSDKEFPLQRGTHGFNLVPNVNSIRDDLQPHAGSQAKPE